MTSQSKPGKVGLQGFWKEHFKGMIIFMPMYSDRDWTKRGNNEHCIANALRDTEYAARTLVVAGAWIREEMVGNPCPQKDVEWDKIDEGLMLNFAERGRHVFRASSALEREELKSKGKGVKTSHFNGSDETIELILRTIISVN